VVAVELTGMGCDGTAGLGPLRRAGAHVIVQDEATSVVWGMPGSAVAAGLADEVLPLERIAAAVAEAAAGRRGARP
jgi:two-component system chemotaxis response regulator CheB